MRKQKTNKDLDSNWSQSNEQNMTRADFPSGTVSFLFTDIEGSTRLAQEFPEAMPSLLARHNEIMRQSIKRHNGFIFQIVGDSFSAAFNNANAAVNAALEAQYSLEKEEWSPAAIKVRMGIHTGAAQLQDESSGSRYSGYSTIALAQRVMSAGHGGQILISQAVHNLLVENPPETIHITDMGEHQLKDVGRNQRLFQVTAPNLPTDFPPLKTQKIINHNLPVQLTSFIGRQHEMIQIKTLMMQTRLLTLLGPGGTGKTRLALQTASDLIDQFPDGVWLVELAPLRDPELIPERIASVLNIQDQSGHPIIDTLTSFLRKKKLLLLLDNVEHLVNACAELVAHLLQNCPELKILATGRESLFIDGETTMQIPSLTLPNEKFQIPEQIASSDAVKLFLERARTVRQDFALTPENAPAIAEVVRRLDGIPLALELAAVRLRMLSVEQISERLNDRFRLLTGGNRNILPRQQTLQALIDWSWQLLDQKETILLRRLSVFSGGWNLEAAQVVAGFDPLDEFSVFDYLEQLINKSLVTVQHPHAGEARYGMLESIRQFAQDKLLEAGEGKILRDRQVDYIVNFSLEAELHLGSATMLDWEKRIIQELDNIRTALTWAINDHPELALRISAALLSDWPQWIHPSEALDWLEGSIEATRGLLSEDNAPVRIVDFLKGLYALGFTHALLGDVPLSLELAEQGIQLAQEHGEFRLYVFGISQKFSGMIQHWLEISEEWLQVVDEAIMICQKEGFELEMGKLHRHMGGFYLARGKFELAKQHFQKWEEIERKYPNPRSHAILLLINAQFFLIQEDIDSALPLYQQASEAFAAINEQRIELITKSTIAHLLRRSGKISEAVPYYQDTIVKWQEQDNPIAIAHQLECFAFIGIANEKYEYSARLLGRAKATRIELEAISKDPKEIVELDQAMSLLAEALGEAERDRWIAEGALMSLDEAVSLALSN